MLSSIVRQIRVALLLVAVLIIFTAQGHTFETSFDLSGGYNDNVVEESSARGSVFSNYSLDIDQELYSSPNSALSSYFAGNYRDHFSLDDQWQATLGISTWERLLAGKIHAKTFAELSRYRDAVIATNERDLWQVGTHWQWFYNEKLSVGGKLSYTDSHYRPTSYASTTASIQTTVTSNTSGAYRGHHQPVTEDSSTLTRTTTSQRDDSLWQFAPSIEYLFNADLSTELTLSYADNNSSYKYESYREKGLESRWFYRLAANGNIELWGTYLWQNYPGRLEHQWLIGSRCDWQIYQNIYIYLHGEKRWHDAPYATDNYTEMVTQCGITWSV